MLSPRERVLMALNHEEPDRVPLGAERGGLNPPAFVALRDYLGITDSELHQKLSQYADIRGIGPRYIGPPLRSFPDGSSEDEWGVIRSPMSYGSGSYHEISYYPLGNVEDISQLDQHRWPSVDWWDVSDISGTIDRINAEDEHAIMVGAGNIFESSWYMRGLQRMMLDLIENPDIAYEIMRRVTDYKIEYLTKILEAARGKIDIVITADDIGGQRGLLMSLDMWTKYLKPHHARMNKVLKEFDVKIMYHSDGSIMDAVPGLIDMGIDILEALQFSADGMDPKVLKEKYGDRLCFHGGISVQTTLPFGTVEDVKREVIERIEVLGKGGGYILAPSHAIQAGTPPENIIAMYETAYSWRYPK